MSRMDQYNVTVVIGDNPALKTTGTWDKMSGGEVDSEESKYRPGNMGAEITLGGYTMVGNITLSRLFIGARDATLLTYLLEQAGRADVTITKQFLDVNKVPFSTPLVYKGKLKSVTPPEHDSESSDPALLEIEVSSASVTKV